MEHQEIARAVVDRHGRTFADEAGITLKDTPKPLWQLLVLSLLLSARIGSGIALSAARELFAAGYRTPERMRDATWQQRVDALGRGHYRRYDERTATQLGELAERVLTEYRGDLRRMRDEDVESAVQGFTGIGPAGAAIFCREVQELWPELAPYVDPLAARGAERLGLPSEPDRLAALVDTGDLTALVAGCVRAARDDAVVQDVLGRPT